MIDNVIVLVLSYLIAWGISGKSPISGVGPSLYMFFAFLILGRIIMRVLRPKLANIVKKIIDEKNEK